MISVRVQTGVRFDKELRLLFREATNNKGLKANEVLPRCHDANILSRAKWLLPRAAFYFAMERWANSAGSAEAYRLQEANESLAKTQKPEASELISTHHGEKLPKSPAVA